MAKEEKEEKEEIPEFFKITGEGVESDFLYMEEDRKSFIPKRATPKGTRVLAEDEAKGLKLPVYCLFCKTLHREKKVFMKVV